MSTKLRYTDFADSFYQAYSTAGLVITGVTYAYGSFALTNTTSVLTLNGRGFDSGTVVKVDGTNVTTSYVSSTQLTFTAPSVSTAGVKTLAITRSDSISVSYPPGLLYGTVTSVGYGEQSYTTAGSYTWVAPSGVTSVCVVCVGAGGGGTSVYDTIQLGRGGGGGLGYKNNITVVPGTGYTVVVGAGGLASTAGGNGGDSYFINATTVKGAGGSNNGIGGSYVGDGGGNGGGGGMTVYLGGGGAGGYSGNGGDGGGGDGVLPTAQSGSGGGGAGGWGGTSNEKGGSSGGGVGLQGQGYGGAPGTIGAYEQAGGGGGSGGANGGRGLYRAQSEPGGAYGGGGGPGGWYATGGVGGVGAVRIIWGTYRFFPSFNTATL